MSFTSFWDMHSGGGLKIKPYEIIYIETKRNLAIAFFKDKFGRDPEHITCDCCGEDYSITEYSSFQEASAYHRKLRYAAPLEPAAIKNKPYLEREKWKTNNAGRYFEPDEKIPHCWDTGTAGSDIGQTVEEYIANTPNILVIRANEII